MPVRVSVTLSFDSLEAARLEALVEAAKKSGAIAATATREEAILAGLAALLQQDGGGAPELEHAPSPNALPGVSAQETPPAAIDLRRRKSITPYKVVLYHCKACKQTEIVTTAGSRPVAPASAAAALENAVIHDQGRNRHAIPPATREQVLARDGHRCQAVGCGSPRFLEIHHEVPRSRGGSNTVENLITLCGRCHRFAHEKGAPW